MTPINRLCYQFFLYYLQIRMNGQEMFIGNRKKNVCDQEPVSKKAGRNQHKKLNKTINTAKMMQEIQIKRNTQKQQTKEKVACKNAMNGLTEKQQKKIDDIKSVLQNHKRETIRRVLQKCNYDKNQAMEELFTMPQDQQQNNSVGASTKQEEGAINELGNETGKGSKKKKQLKQSNQEIANQILNEMYDNQEEIDPSQFEQLFQEIARIIKEQQKIQGMDVFQINQFIDNCYLIKNVILEDQSDIFVDENNEIYLKTQIFLEELIKSRVAQENKRKQEFPTLGAVDKNTSSNKGYIQKIQDQYKVEKQKQDYFTPSKVPQIQYHPQNNFHQYSLYSVNNDPKSHANILQLSKEYNDMGIENLKFIYLRLQDINLCKQFLNRFYPSKKVEIKVGKVQEKKNSTSPNQYKKVVPQAKYKRIQDDNYNKYSLEQIRDQLDHLFKLRSVFRMTRGRISNVAQRKQLQRLACRQNPRIEKLSQVARYKTLERMVETNPQYIDLHGYRQEQIQDLFDNIEDMIRTEFDKGNPNLKPIKIGNKVYCIVQALTGKGLHSKYNKSVLKPALLDWCSRAGVQAIETEDSINIHFAVR